MRLTRLITLMMIVIMGFGSAGDTAPFLLNTMVSPAVDSLSVPWNSAWIGGYGNATVVIADNGTELRRVTGAGEFAYSGTIGRHELTYTTYVYGLALNEVSVTVYVQLKYEVVNGGAVITEKAPSSPAVTIPSEIDGYPVTGVSNMRVDGNGNDGTTTVTLRANGSGRLSFRWKASSEYDLETGDIYDYGYLTVDGVARGTLDENTGTLVGYAIGGATDWVDVAFDVAGAGEHTFVWAYKKDAYQEEGLPIEDCIWLDQVVWASRIAVSFDGGGGTGTVPATINDLLSGAIVTLPSADGLTKARHAFAGWSDGVNVYAGGADYVVPSTNATLTAQWRAKTLARPTISSMQVTNGGTVDDSASVTLALSAEAGATIHYTLDGSNPTADSPVCTGQLVLTGLSVTVKAIAVRDDCFDSGVAEFSFTRVPYTLAECLGVGGVPNVTVTAGGDSPAWHRVVGAETHDGGVGLRSGAITHSQTNWVEMTVSGPGTLTFWWKASSEKTARGQIRDGAMFFVDGAQVGGMIGGTDLDWAQASYEVADACTHTFRWSYGKSEADMANVGEDCAWLDDVSWTQTQDDPIPAIGGDGDVAEALAGSADGRLGKHVKTAAEYGAYRGWADANGLDHGTVKNSSRAWFSYALDASNLVERAFQDGDVAIVSLETASDGTFTFEVDVDGVLIGASATEKHLATVFEVQGSFSLSSNSFSAVNVDATLGVSTNGKLLVSATPKVECGTFFIRVRMYADEDEPGDDELEVEDTYTVTYTPGASGSGSQQTATKTHGVALTLRGATFTRSGYTQTGWSTSDGGAKVYDLGAFYTSNAAVTLYPYWTADTYTVTYKSGANGSGAQQTATKTHGVALTLKGATFTRSGYTQTGWSTSDGGSKTYDLGASYTSNAAVTLYPFWTANSGADTHASVQLWEGGPYWATTNIGAENPEDYGYYFWWGDTVGYTNTGSGWISVTDGTSISFGDSDTSLSTYDKDNSALLSEGYIDATTNLAAAHDAATAHLGSPWRMPTDAEFSALISNCTTTWITTNGVKGRLMTGKGAYADRSIFLPAAGYGDPSNIAGSGLLCHYWSSTPDSSDSRYAWTLLFYRSSYIKLDSNYRCSGRPVRPVRGAE